MKIFLSFYLVFMYIKKYIFFNIWNSGFKLYINIFYIIMNRLFLLLINWVMIIFFYNCVRGKLILEVYEKKMNDEY